MLNPFSPETPSRMGCGTSLLHWERGSSPSKRRSNEGVCELLTKDACVLHVVRVVPRPKGKLPQLRRPRETNHKSTRPGLTHGVLGSLTSLPPFNFPSLLPFLLPPLPLPPAVPLLGPLPQRRPPRHNMHRFRGNHRTTQPHPSREGRPSSLGGCSQQGVVDGGDGLLCGLGPQPGRPSQRGSHPLHNAHCSGYQHTAGVRCPLPTAHCPLSPFCFLPLHAVPGLVPGPH